jgi:hypothetical protein
VIGAGWTGFIGTVGLKSDYAQRKGAKDGLIDNLTDTAQKLEQARNEAVDRLTTLPGLSADAAAQGFVEHIQPVLELTPNGTTGIDLQQGYIDALQRRANVVKAL